MKNTNKLKNAMKKKQKGSQVFLSSGSTPLDIALSGTIKGAYPLGIYVNYIGDSSSGKTMLTLTALAEAAYNPNFDKHRLIFIDAENGALMDVRKFFGKLADRIEVFNFQGKTIEDFYILMSDFYEKGQPFVCVLDSMDALTSKEEETKFQEFKKAKDKNKVAGEMSDGKAKKNSKYLRRTVGRLSDNGGSILLILSQTRDNMGFGAQFNPKVRAGGRALKFYAGVEVWTSIVGSIKKSVQGKQRKVGIVCRCEIKKNRLTGNDCSVDIPILRKYGVDDVASCIKYLVEDASWWKKNTTTGKIIAPEFDFEGKESKLIQLIEDEGLQKDLKLVVSEAWASIEEALSTGRRSRYE